MTAANRPSVTDNARAVREAAMDLYRAMRRTNPDAWAEVDEVEDWTYWDDIVRTAQVTLAAGRAETTTATTEDAARAIHDRHCTSDDHGPHCMFWDEDYESAEALHARGLLATARTRPTRYEVARAIRLSRTNGLCKPGVRCDLCDCAQVYEDDLALRDADAVLALWAGQPTEAEAGARALEQAAEQTYTKSNAQWLRDRAASLRGGER